MTGENRRGLFDHLADESDDESSEPEAVSAHDPLVSRFIHGREDGMSEMHVAMAISKVVMSESFELGVAETPDGEPMVVVGGPVPHHGFEHMASADSIDVERTLAIADDDSDLVVAYYV